MPPTDRKYELRRVEVFTMDPFDADAQEDGGKDFGTFWYVWAWPGLRRGVRMCEE